MFVEVLQAVLSFDIGFFLDLVMGNLFWLFALGMAAYILSDKRNWIWNFIAVTLMLYATTDLAEYLGWSFWVEGFLLLPVYILLSNIIIGKLTNNYAFLGSKAKYAPYFIFASVLVLTNLWGVLF
ncbi:MAG: hypothetical protein ABIA76_02195 [Candidatus Diapherotrites archaeon]